MADFWAERLEKAKQQLTALDEAISALESGAQSYTLDTGQSRQTVTRHQIGDLYRRQEKLLEQIASLESRCSGGGAFVARPGF